MLGSAKLVIKDKTPTYRVYYASSSDIEGNDGLARGGGFAIMTRNVPYGTVVYWEIVGVTGTITAGDFSPASLTGSTTLTFNYAGTPYTNDGDSTLLGPNYFGDQLTEGNESFFIRLRTGSQAGPIVATSNTITLFDYSVGTPSYAVAPAAGSVNEGSSLTFNVSTTNVVNGTTLYYTITNSGDFNAPTSGSFSITSNAGSFSVVATADSTTEGAETFTASVRTGSTSGTVVATSSSVTINDTSLSSLGPYSDANAAYLRLALPFRTTTGLDDIAYLFTGSPNTAACTRTGPSSGAVVITTADSKYYGSSAFGNNAGDALAYTLPVNIVTGSAFVIEFWAKVNTTSSNNWIFGDGYSARELAVGPYNGGGLPGALNVASGSGRIGGVGTGWNHYSFSNTHWFFNGTLRGTCNWGASGWSFNLIRVMQQEIGDPNDFRGWVNDFRVYVGATRAISFTPPTQMIPT
jgi:hypothetical protein